MFYTFKDNVINNTLTQIQALMGSQSTHRIAGARYMIKDQYGITQNEQGWDDIEQMNNIYNRLNTEFSSDKTVKESIDFVTGRLIDNLKDIAYSDGLYNELNTNVRNIIGNPTFEAKNLFDIDWDQNPKNLNFEVMIRQQVIQNSVNRLEFIVDPIMKVLAMDSVFDLIMTASGSKVESRLETDGFNNELLVKTYTPQDNWNKIPLQRDFSSLDEILENLKLVSSEEHKNETMAMLHKVKEELNSLNRVDQLKNEQTQKIDNCITYLNNLTAQQYAANAEQLRQEQLNSLNLDVIISMYTASNSVVNFQNNLWNKYNLLVGAENQDQFNEKAEALYESFRKINPTNAEDLKVTLWEDIKAFLLFITKCVLTVGILPVIEAVEGKSFIISSDRELKTIAQEKQTSFVDFVSNRGNPAAAPQPGGNGL